jgi:hypothetical protein
MCANKASDNSDYVPVVVAHDEEEAERYVQLLQDHDIPAMLGTEEDLLVAMAADEDDDDDGGLSDGSVVLVPSDHYDEASEFIAELDDFDGIEHLEDGEVTEDDEEEEISLQPEDMDDSLVEEDSPYDHQPDGGEEFEGLDFDFDDEVFSDEDLDEDDLDEGLDDEDMDDELDL